jgi:hypothetical protein
MKLNVKTADIFLDRLSGTGPQGRAKKRILQFRREPSLERRQAALRAIGTLDQNTQTNLRQAARL